MSLNNKTKRTQREKKTEVLRGRCEKSLKREFVDYVNTTPFAESHWVRQAVSEFVQNKKANPHTA